MNKQENKIYESYIQCPHCLKKLKMKDITSFTKIPYCSNCNILYEVVITHDLKILIKEK